MPYTTAGTTTEWTTEGLPDDVSHDEKPTAEINEASKPNDVPGSEIKVALPGKDGLCGVWPILVSEVQ